jgi:hypothetical protein
MRFRLIVYVLAAICFSGCQAAPAVEPAAITVIPIVSSTAEPTQSPTETATPQPLSGERQELEGYFSFIASDAYIAELEAKSAFISDEGEQVFISFAIIGEGEDERTAHSLIEQIFARFEGHELQNVSVTSVGGFEGSKTEFSGLLNSTVVSGNYIIVDLSEEVSFLAFGMGYVTKEIDNWESSGRVEFARMLDTVEIVFGTY